MAAGIALWSLAGCASQHSHKVHAYDQAISDDDRDPTFRSDPERADEEVRQQ
jgi:hypothetical protein